MRKFLHCGNKYPFLYVAHWHVDFAHALEHYFTITTSELVRKRRLPKEVREDDQDCFAFEESVADSKVQTYLLERNINAKVKEQKGKSSFIRVLDVVKERLFYGRAPTLPSVEEYFSSMVEYLLYEINFSMSGEQVIRCIEYLLYEYWKASYAICIAKLRKIINALFSDLYRKGTEESAQDEKTHFSLNWTDTAKLLVCFYFRMTTQREEVTINYLTKAMDAIIYNRALQRNADNERISNVSQCFKEVEENLLLIFGSKCLGKLRQAFTIYVMEKDNKKIPEGFMGIHWFNFLYYLKSEHLKKKQQKWAQKTRSSGFNRHSPSDLYRQKKLWLQTFTAEHHCFSQTMTMDVCKRKGLDYFVRTARRFGWLNSHTGRLKDPNMLDLITPFIGFYCIDHHYSSFEDVEKIINKMSLPWHVFAFNVCAYPSRFAYNKITFQEPPPFSADIVNAHISHLGHYLCSPNLP
ncbi:hypothetical protein RFI_24506, partial [Reticulomyxa filosa]